MKKMLIWPLALLMILLASYAQADVTDDLREQLASLPPHIKVECGSIEASADQSVLTLRQVKVSYIASEAKEDDKPSSQASAVYAPRQGYVESIVITNYNFDALKQAGVVPLASRIEANNIRVVFLEGDTEITIKQKVVENPVGPWSQLLALGGNQHKLNEMMRQLALVHVDALSYVGLSMVDSSRYGSAISIDKIDARDYSIAKCPDMMIVNFKNTPPEEGRGNHNVAIGQLKISYDLSAPISAMFARDDLKWEDCSLSRYYDMPYTYSLNATNIKASVNGLPFTIGQVMFSQDNLPEYVGKFVMDTFKIESKDAGRYGFLSGKQMQTLLKGKPFVLSINATSRLAAGSYYPTHFNISAPNLANLDVKAMLALKSDYVKTWDRYFKPGSDGLHDYSLFEDWDWLAQSTMIKELVISYQDKGLINGALAIYAGDRDATLAQARNDAVEQIEREIKYEKPGVFLDFLKSVKGLVQKPGTLTFTLTPKTPNTLQKVFQQLEENPKAVNYSFKLK